MCLKLNACGSISHVVNTSSCTDSCYGDCENSNETLNVKDKNINGCKFKEHERLNNMEKLSDNSFNINCKEMESNEIKVAENSSGDQNKDSETVNEMKESDTNNSESCDSNSISQESFEKPKMCNFQITVNKYTDEEDESDSKTSQNHSPRKKYCLRKSRKPQKVETKRNKMTTKNQIDAIADRLSSRSTGSEKPFSSEEEISIPNSKGTNNKKKKRKKLPQSVIKYHNTSGGIQKEEDRKRYQCHICGKILKSSSAVTVHQRIHTGEKPFSCTICNKSFSVKESLNRHIRTHTGEKPYVCSYCGETFGQAASLKRHMGRHTGNYPFKCHMCDKRYIQHSDLLGHLRSHEGLKREKLWTCEVCGSGFVSTRNLIRHVKWIHIAEKPFVCDVCGKGFIEMGKLSAHQRYHTGERPFKCENCGRGFVDRSYLREHLKLHEDKGKKTYDCTMCEKRFASSKSLHRHVRTIHTKEEVYTCNICWKSFGQSGNLKIHRIRHHRSEYVKSGSKDDVVDEEDDVYEQYIIQQNKILLEKSLQADGDSGCVESAVQYQKLKNFDNISREDILKKFGRQKLQASSGESVEEVSVEREDDKKSTLNSDGVSYNEQLREVDGDKVKGLKITD